MTEYAHQSCKFSCEELGSNAKKYAAKSRRVARILAMFVALFDFSLLHFIFKYLCIKNPISYKQLINPNNNKIKIPNTTAQRIKNISPNHGLICRMLFFLGIVLWESLPIE